MGKVPRSQRSANSPSRGDMAQRQDHEHTPLERQVRDGQAPGFHRRPVPGEDIEVENARAPASARTPAECPLDRFQLSQHGIRRLLTLDQRHGVGEVASGAALGRVEQDWRGVEQTEALVELPDRRLNDAGRAAVAAVRAVGTDGDGVEVGRGGRAGGWNRGRWR
jgi:hypothetical protein